MHNTTGQFEPSVHGFNGPLLTSLPGFPADIDGRVTNTTVVLKDEFPFNIDMNSGNPLGVGWLQSTIGNGVRSSSATAFLTPALNRPNVDVLVETQVTRLLQTGTSGSVPVLQGVEFAQTRTGTIHSYSKHIKVSFSDKKNYRTPLQCYSEKGGYTIRRVYWYSTDINAIWRR